MQKNTNDHRQSKKEMREKLAPTDKPVTIENQNQGHNAKKEALGPNTRH